jgi:hypothetical protein
MDDDNGINLATASSMVNMANMSAKRDDSHSIFQDVTTVLQDTSRAAGLAHNVDASEMQAVKRRALRQDRITFRTNIGMALIAVVGYMMLMHLFVGHAEGWTLIDSCYFSITTVTTVGYGDISPTKIAGKWYILFAAPLGVVLIGVSLHRLAMAMIRFEERLRHDVQIAADQVALHSARDALANLSRRASSGASKLGSHPKMLKGVQLVEKCIPVDLVTGTIQQLMQVIGYLCVGAAILIKIEEGTQTLSFFDGLYCCVITLSSVGFGDISPLTQQGRLFSIFYIPMGVLVLTSTISTLAHRYSMYFHASASAEKNQLGLLMKTLEWYGKEGVITEADFMCAMLHTNKGIAQEYLMLIRGKFEVWDALDTKHEHGVSIKILMDALKNRYLEKAGEKVEGDTAIGDTGTGVGGGQDAARDEGMLGRMTRRLSHNQPGRHENNVINRPAKSIV